MSEPSETAFDIVELYPPENAPTVFYSFYCKSIKSMWKEKRYTDTVVSIGEKEFHCHKLVLASMSPYFDAMYSCGLEESRDADGHVKLQGISSDTFSEILKFIYSCGIISVEFERLQDLMEAAAMLQIRPMQERIEAYLPTRLERDNCIVFWKLAKQYNYDITAKCAFAFIVENFTDVVETEEFISLTATELQHIIKDNMLNSEDEEGVCDAVLQWFSVDIESRLSELSNVLCHIRLPLLSEDYVESKLASNYDILADSKCQDIILSAKDTDRECDVELLTDDAAISSPAFKERCERIVVCTSLGFGEPMHGLSVHNNKMYILPGSEAISRPGAIVCVHNGDLFLSGGNLAPKLPTNDLYKFEIDAGLWHVRHGMIVDRSHHAMVSVGKCIYVLGGYGRNDTYLSSVEEYDVEKDSWQIVHHLLNPIAAPSSAVFDNVIFLFGGRTENKPEGTSFILAFNTNTRSDMIDSFLPFICFWSQAVVFNQMVYVVGPRGSVGEVLVEHDSRLKRNVAKCLCSMRGIIDTIPKFNRSYFGCVAYHNQIRVFGGRNSFFDLVYDDIYSVDPLSPSIYSDSRLRQSLPHELHGGSWVEVTICRSHLQPS